MPGTAKVAYTGMANFRYLHTFIDEESAGVELPRSRSCPDLSQAHVDADEQNSPEHAMAIYVAELWQRTQILTGLMRVAPVQQPVAAVPVDAEEVESVAADELPTNTGPEEPILPDMAATETIAAEADMKTEMGRQEASQEEDAQKCDSAAATSSATPVRHALIQGSRGHPFLCARPCIRLAKGSCHMGDACGYCHHSTHPRFAALDKRQRLQVHNMDTSWPVQNIFSEHFCLLCCVQLFKSQRTSSSHMVVEQFWSLLAKVCGFLACKKRP